METNLFDEVRKRLLEQANREKINQIRTLNTNKTNSIKDAKSDYGITNYNITFKQEAIEKEKLGTFANTELRNLAARNQLKSIMAISGVSVGGASSVQDIYEESELSSVLAKEETQQLDTEILRGIEKTNLQNTFNTITNQYNSEQQKINQNYQNITNRIESQYQQDKLNVERYNQQISLKKMESDRLKSMLNSENKKITLPTFQTMKVNQNNTINSGMVDINGFKKVTLSNDVRIRLKEYGIL